MKPLSIDRGRAPGDDAELAILENIYASQKRSRALTQRDLAEAAGLSLGMTNALLKRFSDKGWVLLKRLNSRNIQYALTPDGVNEIAHRTYRYFKRTARAAGLYRDMIEAFVMDKKRAGATRLVLSGLSDLDFLIEYACERHGLLFVKSIDAGKAVRLGDDPGTVIIHAEGDEPPAFGSHGPEKTGGFPEEFLSRVIVGVGPERRYG
jgi:DNA-binding MarR family transcriptional regulator